MRTTQIIGIGIVALGLTQAAFAQAPQDADRKVTGGVTVPGWKGKEDTGNKQGLTVNDSKFAPEGKAFRLITGPAGSVLERQQHGEGRLLGEGDLHRSLADLQSSRIPLASSSAATRSTAVRPAALYCVAYRNGNYIVRGFSGGKRFDVVAKPAPNDAVKKAAAADAEVVQEVGWNVRGDSVECVINGTSVWKGTKADVTGPGKLTSTDGIAGIRVSHNSDALVTGFAVSK